VEEIYLRNGAILINFQLVNNQWMQTVQLNYPQGYQLTMDVSVSIPANLASNYKLLDPRHCSFAISQLGATT
jgi:hypothetical protein